MTRLPVLLATLLAACSAPPGPDPNGCGLRGPGLVVGEPSLVMGRGSQAFVPAVDGDTFQAVNGPQGGSHIWVSLRSTGIGPDLRLEYRYEEPDGGTIFVTRGSTTLCAAGPTAQERVGVAALLPDEAAAKQRVLCGGAFRLRVQAGDVGGHDVEDSRVVGRVEGDPASFIPFRLRCDGGM